uniref:Uncharacterized protein n=1 Tax=Arundo donax TaxID=35708 RepID=A0A0A9E5I9_ARUDO
MTQKKLKTLQLWSTSSLRRLHAYWFLTPSMRSVQLRERILQMLCCCEAAVSGLRYLPLRPSMDLHHAW